MKAVTWHGKRDVRVDEVPDPVIQEPTDAIVRMTTTNLCGGSSHPGGGLPLVAMSGAIAAGLCTDDLGRRER